MKRIPVNIAAQIVAAGIDGSRARITLALTPVFDKDNGRYDLANWPREVEMRFLADAADGDSGVEVKKFRLDVVPLADEQSWRTPNVFNAASPIEQGPKNLERVAPPKAGDVEKLNAYWQSVMAGVKEDKTKKDGFDYLYDALDPASTEQLSDPIQEAMRPTNDKLQDPSAPKQTPDIHGTARAKAADELVHERARRILARFGNDSVKTRPAADPSKSLSEKVKDWRKSRVGPWPSKKRGELTDATLAALAEDNGAWDDLSASRDRADKFAAARSEFQETTNSPKDAISALVAAHDHLLWRTPFAVAEHFSAEESTMTAVIRNDPMKEAIAAYRLGSETPTFDGAKMEFSAREQPAPGIEFARRRLYMLQSNPSLGRLFRFVVDFECPVKVLDDLMTVGKAQGYKEVVLDRPLGAPDVLPEALEQNSYFLLARFVRDKGPRLWSTTKLRIPRDDQKNRAAGHFLPCTREEVDTRIMNRIHDKECEKECKKNPNGTACKECMARARKLRELAVAEQIDGIVDLGQRWGEGKKIEHRYEVVTLDPVVGTAAEDQKIKRDHEDQSTLKLPGLPPHVRTALNEPLERTHRGGGLALVDRWRQLHGIGRHLDSRAQKEQYEKSSSTPDIVLDASDLVAGYKLDVGVLHRGDDNIKRRRWHTLMHRTVTYTPTKGVPANLGTPLDSYISGLYPKDARGDADDGQLQAPAALRAWDGTLTRTDASKLPLSGMTAFMEEVIGAWRGDPLGLACGVETHKLDPNDVRIDVSYDLPTNQELTPPPLRFGWRYHFGLRACFAGGISMPLYRALGHYEKSYGGDLVRPTVANGGEAFRRHERIDAPTIAVPDWMFGTPKKREHHTDIELIGRFPVPQASRMVVRSFDDETNRSIAGLSGKGESELKATPGVGFDRRVLMAPPVALHFAALHDAFRGKSGDDDIESNIQMCEPRVLLGDKPTAEDPFGTDKVDGEDIQVEFTPVLDPKPRITDPSKPNPPAPTKWGMVRVAWRPYIIKSRPRGGLRGVDYRAAWGGFPIYRAKASVGLTPPRLGAPVVRPAAMTDAGEILHRVKRNGATIFDDIPSKRKQLLWSAVGVFEKEDGQSDRSGTAVFRAAGTFSDVPNERSPYYPDPAAMSMVIEVSIRGQAEPHRKTVALYEDKKFDRGVATDYPNAKPIVLDVERATGAGEVISEPSKMNYRNVRNTPSGAPSITVMYVKVRLAPGDEATIRTWCIPSLKFLSFMWAQTHYCASLAVARGLRDKAETSSLSALSAATVDDYFVNGIRELTGLELPALEKSTSGQIAPTFAGVPMPSEKQIRGLAEKLHQRMLEAPWAGRKAFARFGMSAMFPEIAAVTEIEAVHAVDLPKRAPKAVAKRKWQLLRTKPDLIEHLLKAEAECKSELAKLKPDLSYLCASNNWTPENQMPDAVDVLIDGSLTVHGPTTDAVEIRARGTAAARGRFDDVERGRSRDDRARGLWPKPDAQQPIAAKSLFGFEPAEDGSVRFEPETVTVLRVEGFSPRQAGTENTEVQIDLLDLQRAAKALEPNPEPSEEIKPHDPPWRASRPAAFPDTCARWIEIYAVAVSRHAAALRTRYDELPEVLTKPESVQPDATKEAKQQAEQLISSAVMERRWLPATVRPARVSALSPIPSFLWSDNTPTPAAAKLPFVFTKRSVRIRVRLKRPWFSAGEGERIGVVIWPPNLFSKDVGNVRYDMVKPPPADRKAINLRTLPEDGTVIRELQDADLGSGGAWVTRWGADPILAQGGVQGWLLSKENFPGVMQAADFSKPPSEHPRDAVLVENVMMPVPADDDAVELRVAHPPGGFMAVSLITYTPRFDADQENWYVDLNVEPCGAVSPQLRLGLVRYQPNAKPELRVSEPIIEWARIMPDRTLAASAKYVHSDRKEIELTAMVEGIMSGPGGNNGHPESSPAQAPSVRFALMQRRVERDDELPGSESVFREPQILEPNCGSTCASWTATFRISDDEYRRFSWSICAEEVDRLRPGTYMDEPRYQTLRDTNFAETGPRFFARLSLDNLKVT